MNNKKDTNKRYTKEEIELLIAKEHSSNNKK